MDQKQIDRINELAKKAKSPEGLTEWEEMERAALRLLRIVKRCRFTDAASFFIIEVE